MLGEPQRSPYDLNFRVFDFPVRIAPWFWLAAIIIGQGAASQGIMGVVWWIVAVFLSILIHELGHSFAFQYFGVSSHIVLYHFGGIAVPEGYGRSWGRPSLDSRAQALIAFAGPFAQIVAAILVIALVGVSGHGFWGSFGIFERILPIPHGKPFAADAANTLLFYFCLVSLYWALLNLIPVYPLDGGQIVRNLMFTWNVSQPIETSLVVSVVAGAGVAFYGFRMGQPFLALMFVMLAYQSYQALNQGGGFGGGYRGGRGW